MAKCGCAGSSCGCLLVAGTGVEITGVGSAANPFTISATAAVLDISTVLQVVDTDTVNISMLGSGTEADPYILSAVATLGIQDLVDVNDPDGPTAGDTLVWVGGGGGHFEFSSVVGTGGTVLPVGSRTNIGGTYTITAGAVDEPAVLLFNLTAATDLVIQDGVPGTAYMCYLDVVPNGNSLGILAGPDFAGVSGSARVVIPLFWSGNAWFPQWLAG